MGTLVEINLHRAFEFDDGLSMDYEIAGVDVDCKYSQTLGGWEFPPEAYDARHLCLVVWASDELSRFSVGLIRAISDVLGAPNREMKRKLVGDGIAAVRGSSNTRRCRKTCCSILMKVFARRSLLREARGTVASVVSTCCSALCSDVWSTAPRLKQLHSRRTR
jgi:hypothetical protein